MSELAQRLARETDENENAPDLASIEKMADALGLNRFDVASVKVTSTASSGHSWFTFFRVAYRGGAAASLPERLVAKHKSLSPSPSLRAKPAPMREVDFYTHLAAGLPSPPVARCLAARASSDTSPGYVLMEDLRATHREPPADETTIDFGPAVDALARVHAARWESPDRSNWPEGSATEQAVLTNLHKMGAHLPAFFDAAGDALTADERRLYERVFSSSLRPFLRPLDGRAVTLTHGSAHIGNFLLPRDPAGDVYLVDWERWRADIGARDLAYLVMLRRSQEGRRQLEETLLRRYLARIEALGVRGYGWDDLWTDYRGCWVRNLTATIRKQHRADEAWRELKDHAIAGIVDLDCEELL
jgi:hypothetical protein